MIKSHKSIENLDEEEEEEEDGDLMKRMTTKKIEI